MKTGHRGLVLTTLVVSTLSAVQARAASFTIEGGDAWTTPAPMNDWRGNDVFGEQPGYVGAQLAFTGVAWQRYMFTFEFLGFEAAWENELQTLGGSIRNKTSGVPTPVGTRTSFAWVATGGADVVPFSFMVFPGDGSSDSVSNGSNPGIGLGRPNFFLSIANDDVTGGTFERSGLVVGLALDDSGAGPDTDHDDWVGLIRVTPVPEPVLVMLLGGGLLASVVRIRRRRRMVLAGRPSLVRRRAAA